MKAKEELKKKQLIVETICKKERAKSIQLLREIQSQAVINHNVAYFQEKRKNELLEAP